MSQKTTEPQKPNELRKSTTSQKSSKISINLNPKKKVIFKVFFPKKSAVILVGVFAALIIILIFYIFCFSRSEENESCCFAQIFRPSQTGSSTGGPLTPPLTEDFNIFYDSFSGLGRVDSSQTTLYLNGPAAAVMFPPDFSFTPTTGIAGEKLFLENFNDFTGPQKAEYCLGQNCLNLDGLKLYYNQRLLTLPSRIKLKDVEAISIDALENTWLVGFTIKYSDKKHRAEVYSFDGKKFTPLVFPKMIISDDFGLVGFGGEDNDFLVIYGAYQGTAYRFRDKKAQDISKFFDIRVMKDGFKAEVTKVKNGADTNWYVSSLTNNRPQFIKLWQNGTEDIVGEVIFDLSATEEQTTQNQATRDRAIDFRLKEIKPKEIIFIAKVKNGSNISLFDFIDRGFKNEIGSYLTFTPISISHEQPLITLKKIKTLKIEVDDPSRDKIKVLFSNDEKTWREVPFGENIDFKTMAISSSTTDINPDAMVPEFFNNFQLQIGFSPDSNKFYSPFLEEFLFEYYCAKKATSSESIQAPN